FGPTFYVAGGAKATLIVLNAPSGLSYNVATGQNVVKRTVTLLTAQKGGVFSFKLKEYNIAVLTTFK
ncbi:hypothetical protein V502_09867, partial [Pseudogymnoascus sp. VKM F-4520 (FW-2644)]